MGVIKRAKARANKVIRIGAKAMAGAYRKSDNK